MPLTKLTAGNFYDIENIQVLRGPQGPLFGRVTDNLLIRPRRPGNDPGGYIEARIGNYDLRATAGALNLPLIEAKIVPFI